MLTLWSRDIGSQRQLVHLERKRYRECADSTKYEAPRDWRPARLLVFHSDQASSDVEQN